MVIGLSLMASMYAQNLSLIAEITGKSDNIMCNMGEYSSLENAAIKNIESSDLRLTGDLEGIAAGELTAAMAKVQAAGFVPGLMGE